MCVTCQDNSCSGGCSTTRIIKNVNASVGRDGLSAYEIYVSLGGTLTEEQWVDLSTESIPTPSNETFIIV